MGGRVGRGALVGAAVGLLVVTLLIWLPQSRQIDFQWITDAFVFMGVPIIVICSAVGAVVGALSSKAAATPDAVGPGAALGPPRQSARARALVVLGAVAAIVLAIWVFLGATGMVSVSPLDLSWPGRA